MSTIPSDLKYAKSHEWAKVGPDGIVTIGITDHAQDALGDLVFVDVPKVGRTVASGESVAVVESVKAASDVYSPVAGEVVEINESLAGSPETLNQDPYGAGWLFKVKTTGGADVTAGLLDASAYEASLA